MERGIYNSSDGFVIVEVGKKVTMGISLAKQGEARLSYVGFRNGCNDKPKGQKVAFHFDDVECIDTLIECLGHIKSYIQGTSVEGLDKRLMECVNRFNANSTKNVREILHYVQNDKVIREICKICG